MLLYFMDWCIDMITETAYMRLNPQIYLGMLLYFMDWRIDMIIETAYMGFLF